MHEIIIDCSNVNSVEEFWDLYLKIVKPEGDMYFGRNLDALWDALAAGGPGFPGDDVETLRLVNCNTLRSIDSGRFYNALLSISKDLTKTGKSIINLLVY